MVAWVVSERELGYDASHSPNAEPSRQHTLNSYLQDKKTHSNNHNILGDNRQFAYTQIQTDEKHASTQQTGERRKHKRKNGAYHIIRAKISSSALTSVMARILDRLKKNPPSPSLYLIFLALLSFWCGWRFSLMVTCHLPPATCFPPASATHHHGILPLLCINGS